MARTRAQDYDRKRAAILKKATHLFARNGYPATSIAMIAEACNASKALFYHYYEDKEHILFDLLQNHMAALTEAVEAAAAKPGKPAEQLLRVIAAIIENYRNADEKHVVQAVNLQYLALARQRTITQMQRRIVATVSACIVRAVPALDGGPFVGAITMSLFGMLNTHHLWFRDGKGLSRLQYCKLATDLIISGAAAAVRAPNNNRGKLPA
jgi:AcrR family transcriptional regulator